MCDSIGYMRIVIYSTAPGNVKLQVKIYKMIVNRNYWKVICVTGNFSRKDAKQQRLQIINYTVNTIFYKSFVKIN